jgi:hypothetical protein
MKYLINSNNFSPDKNFDFQFKDEETISLLMVDENVEEVTEFVVSPDEAWYLPFKVGPFIEKTPKSYFKNCVLVKYQRHSSQVGSIMRSQAYERGLKDAKKHKMPKRRK